MRAEMAEVNPVPSPNMFIRVAFSFSWQVGSEVEMHGPMGAVESVKAASDVYAPVSGAARREAWRLAGLAR